MKVALALVCVLAAVALNSSSVIRASPRTNLYIGYINAGDRLLYRTYVTRNRLPNVQYEDIIFRGNSSTRVTAVQATEVGGTQWASAWIVAGGLGANNVTVRFQSYANFGYYYLLDIWGRY